MRYAILALLAGAALAAIAYRESHARLADDRALLDEYEAETDAAIARWAATWDSLYTRGERLRIAAGAVQ